jgi:hypothetical protein
MPTLTTEYLDLLLGGQAQAAGPSSVLFSTAQAGHLQFSDNSPLLPSASPLSVRAWVNPSAAALAAGTHPIVSQSDGSTNNRTYLLTLTTGGFAWMRWSVDGLNWVGVQNTTNPATVSTWMHVLTWWDAVANADMVVNGGALATVAGLPPPLHTSSVPFAVGYVGPATTPFWWDGALAGLATLNAVPSPAQQAELYNGGSYLYFDQLSAGTQALVSNWWDLNETPPGPWANKVPGGKNLVAVGSVSAGPAPPA